MSRQSKNNLMTAHDSYLKYWNDQILDQPAKGAKTSRNITPIAPRSHTWKQSRTEVVEKFAAKRLLCISHA